MPSIEEQLEAARRSLLDLSRRNHLLNYKQAKARPILYLALGFLEWTESDSALETRQAPPIY